MTYKSFRKSKLICYLVYKFKWLIRFQSNECEKSYQITYFKMCSVEMCKLNLNKGLRRMEARIDYLVEVVGKF